MKDMKNLASRSLSGFIVFALTWIATIALLTCFIGTAKDIPPAINTIVSVIVGGFVGVLTGRQHEVPASQDPPKE